MKKKIPPKASYLLLQEVLMSLRPQDFLLLGERNRMGYEKHQQEGEAASDWIFTITTGHYQMR